MAYSNGQIPRSTLAQISSGHRLRADAAAAFKRLDEAFLREFKKRISVTDGYRDLAQQVAVKAIKGKFAATPGTSNHGWGIALDLGSGINSATSREHGWMDAVAHEHGWVNPAWARDSISSNGQFEPWHWEYVPHLDQHDGVGKSLASRPTSQEDDVSLTPEQAAQLNRIEVALKVPGQPYYWPEAINNLLRAVGGDVSTVKATDGRIETMLKHPQFPFGYPAATHNAVNAVITEVAALRAVLEAHAASSATGVTPDLVAAAKAGAQQALSDLATALDPKE